MQLLSDSQYDTTVAEAVQPDQETAGSEEREDRMRDSGTSRDDDENDLVIVAGDNNVIANIEKDNDNESGNAKVDFVETNCHTVQDTTQHL